MDSCSFVDSKQAFASAVGMMEYSGFDNRSVVKFCDNKFNVTLVFGELTRTLAGLVKEQLSEL